MADRQFDAYNSLPESEVWDGNLKDLPTEAVHEPITSLDEIRLPDAYEEENWDMARSGPKSIEEANEAIRERVADPKAPDNRFWDYTKDGQ